MSEHSIEELERQWKSADGKARDAARAAREAKDRLEAAKFEATGFKDCVAEYERTTWRNSKPQIIRFLPNSIKWGNLHGPILKKDGTPGERHGDCPIPKARNLGPFEALRTSQDKGEPTNG